MTASKMHTEIIEMQQARIASLVAEIAALRQIITDTVAALDSGAGVGVECSLGFLKQIPEEVRETTKALRKDAERLDWLDQQGYAYGFQDMHEGNRWLIEGPFSSLRVAIDAELTQVVQP